MNHYVQPKSVPQTDGPYSQIVVDGQYAHFSGLVAADLADAQAVLGDMGKETRAVMSAIQSMLAELDLDIVCAEHWPSPPSS